MHRFRDFIKSYNLGDYLSWTACIVAAIAICFFLSGLRSKETPEPPAPQGDDPHTETIRVLVGQEAVDMDLLTYLTGVLAVEMGPTFSEEALKAQAVAAYSYAKFKMVNSPGSHKGGADICNSPSHCQGCTTELTYYSGKDGSVAEQASAKADWEYMQSCARQVLGYQVEYQGEVINAMYHDSSPYSTVSFQSVYGYDVPYLQAVSSPSLAGFEPRRQLYIFTRQELNSATSTTLEGNAITLITEANTGRVNSISIGETTMTGVDFRSKTGIRSTCFSLSCQSDKVYIYTLGWGHGIGLCQRGAEVMSRQGSSWQEILTHYYTGVTIVDTSST